MATAKRRRRLRPDADLLAVIVVNLVPVSGLLWFDMSVPGLVVFYWLEFTVLSVWALVRATFAGRLPPDGYVHPVFGDRSWGGGGIPVPRTGLVVHYRTLRELLLAGPLLAMVWLGFGGLVAGPVIAASATADPPLWVITGTLTIFLTEGGRVATGYFHRGNYRHTTVWGPVKGLLWQGLVLVGVALGILLLAREATDGQPQSLERAATGPLVASVVSIKFGTDLARYHLDTADRAPTG